VEEQPLLPISETGARGTHLDPTVRKGVIDRVAVHPQ
jgi:hypothetical protein